MPAFSLLPKPSALLPLLLAAAFLPPAFVQAEEEAAKVSPKLTVIMILFLLPVLGMVLMGPALIRVYRLWSAR